MWRYTLQMFCNVIFFEIGIDISRKRVYNIGGNHEKRDLYSFFFNFAEKQSNQSQIEKQIENFAKNIANYE